MATSNIFRRVLVYGFGTLGVLTMVSAFVWYEYLRSYAPRQPNVATGQIYPMIMQQPFDVYLTKFQTEWVDSGWFIGAALVFVAGYLNMRWKIIPDRPYLPKPKKLY
ncbi:MAG: hypothetical protein WAO21_08710 [Verrucomicrobiia bacterium]